MSENDVDSMKASGLFGWYCDWERKKRTTRMIDVLDNVNDDEGWMTKPL